MNTTVLAVTLVGLFLLVCWSAWYARERELKTPRGALQSPLLVSGDAGSANGYAPGPQHRLDAAS
ncbi:hypothetical protein Gpo141_00014811, partial [Globisporangium polare]